MADETEPEPDEDPTAGRPADAMPEFVGDWVSLEETEDGTPTYSIDWDPEDDGPDSAASSRGGAPGGAGVAANVGWLFKVDRTLDDVETTLAERGTVTTLRVPLSDRLGRLEPGQAAFLYASGRHPDGRDEPLVVGAGIVIGLGEDEDEAGDAAGDGSRIVEVAINPLLEPIHRGTLLKHAVLAGSELFTARSQPNPLLLTGPEVAALIATYDLDVEEPHVPLVRVIDRPGEPGFTVDAVDDGTWVVTRFDEDGETTTETHPTATAATASISAEVAAIGDRLASQVDENGDAEDLEPLVIFDGGYGRELSIFKIAHRYAVFEVHEDGQVDPPLLGAMDDLDAGMISLAGHLSGEHEHSHTHDHGGGHDHDHGHARGHDHGGGHECSCGRDH